MDGVNARKSANCVVVTTQTKDTESRQRHAKELVYSVHFPLPPAKSYLGVFDVLLLEQSARQLVQQVSSHLIRQKNNES